MRISKAKSGTVYASSGRQSATRRAWNNIILDEQQLSLKRGTYIEEGVSADGLWLELRRITIANGTRNVVVIAGGEAYTVQRSIAAFSSGLAADLQAKLSVALTGTSLADVGIGDVESDEPSPAEKTVGGKKKPAAARQDF